MRNPNEIIPGILFNSYLTSARKEKVGFFEHSTLVLQVAGQLVFRTDREQFSTSKGDVMLVRKNQLAELSKVPLPDGVYQTIVIRLKEDFLRQIALEQQVSQTIGYSGPSNIVIPSNDFLQGYFQSIVPYVQHPEQQLTDALGLLKVREAVQLLLHINPALKDFLFDFSVPHKIDLQAFMRKNYHYNISIARFAQLTGRSLAAFKRDFQSAFGESPRKWLQEQRLAEASRLIQEKQLKPSAIYLDLGFESLSHFSHAFKKKYGKTPSEYSSITVR